MRAILSIVLAILSLIMLPLCVVVILLIIQAEADHSRFFGFGFLALFITVVLWFQHLTSEFGRSGWWTVLFVLITGGLFGWCYHTAPTGSSDHTPTMFDSVYLDSNAVYPRWHPANLVAEPDQLKVASALATLGGFNLDRTGGKQTRELITQHYQELRLQAPELKDYGSQLHACYDEWLGIRRPVDHVYVYRPTTIARREAGLPVLLLLHGKTGSLKAGLWALRHVADELGMAIVAPNFGLGRWEHRQDDGLKAVKAAISFCAKDPGLRSSGMIVVGYGAGGKGVSEALGALPEIFRGAIYLGAQLDRTDAFALIGDQATASSRPPVLIVQGDQDTKATIDEIEFVHGEMTRFNVPVVLARFEDEGPLVLFSQPKRVCKKIADWVRSGRTEWPSRDALQSGRSR